MGGEVESVGRSQAGHPAGLLARWARWVSRFVHQPKQLTRWVARFVHQPRWTGQSKTQRTARLPDRGTPALQETDRSCHKSAQRQGGSPHRTDIAVSSGGSCPQAVRIAPAAALAAFAHTEGSGAAWPPVSPGKRDSAQSSYVSFLVDQLPAIGKPRASRWLLIWTIRMYALLRQPLVALAHSSEVDILVYSAVRPAYRAIAAFEGRHEILPVLCLGTHVETSAGCCQH